MLAIALIMFSVAAIYFTTHLPRQSPIIAQLQPRLPIKQAPVLAARVSPVHINIKTAAATKTSVKNNPYLITYSIEHTKNAPIDNVPLHEAKLNVQVYYYGNPRGQISVVTGKDQSFTIGKFRAKSAVSLEVLSIENEEDYDARCTGYAEPGNTQIFITCHPKRKS